MLVFLYKMYVHPQLKYCVQVWNPFLAKDIDLLEKVQRRATKCLHSLSNLYSSVHGVTLAVSEGHQPYYQLETVHAVTHLQH